MLDVEPMRMMQGGVATTTPRSGGTRNPPGWLASGHAMLAVPGAGLLLLAVL